MDKIISTTRECKIRRVPTGEVKILPQGEFVKITQDLGGNYTITWQGNMWRIDGTDADALGRKPTILSFTPAADGRINEEQVWQALRSVYDPEIPIDLVSLGLIYAVNIHQETATVDITMTLTAPGCGMGPVLVGDVEYRVSMVPFVKTVTVELVFDPPWSRDKMSEEALLEAGLFF